MATNFIRSITVAARGEVAALRDNINTMIATLRETTHQQRFYELSD